MKIESSSGSQAVWVFTQMKTGLSWTRQSAEGFTLHFNRIFPYVAERGSQGDTTLLEEWQKCLWSRLINWKNKKIKNLQSDLFLGKTKHFICDPGESRYEPGALMKRVEHPANTLTGPWWLLGNKAKWLLSDLVCLSTAAPHLWPCALLRSA